MERRTAAGTDRDRMTVVLAVSLSVFAVEIVGAILSNSLALLADAGHTFADAAGLAVALFAIWLARRPTDTSRTFGLYRAEIVAAASNAVLLLAIAGYIVYEAARRIVEPAEVASGPMLAFAVVGLAANLFSAWLLRDARSRSLNARAAFLEVISDAAGSAAVLVAAAAIAVSGFARADPIASLIIGVLILPRTWRLMRDAVDVLLEATPKDIDMADVRRHILEAPGVLDTHDLHAWAITSGMNVVSAHVVVDRAADTGAILDHLCRCLSSQFDVDHSTFQLETEDRQRLEEAAHP